MRNRIIIVHTSSGAPYANRIRRSLEFLRMNHRTGITSEVISVNQLPDAYDNPGKVLIHARAAIPEARWMDKLAALENQGVKVVNSPDVLRLTSDKLKSSLLLNQELGDNLCPKTWELDRDEEKNNNDVFRTLPAGEYVLKPYISMEQGASVTKFINDCSDQALDLFVRTIGEMPTTKVVLQTFVPYTGIHRVIVINNKALPFTFMDMVKYHPENWKVSVCLNKTTMKFNPLPNFKLLNLAERIQQIIGGNINFVDIFETNNGYMLSEINTACNLHIHENLSDVNIHFKIAKELVRLAND